MLHITRIAQRSENIEQECPRFTLSSLSNDEVNLLPACSTTSKLEVAYLGNELARAAQLATMIWQYHRLVCLDFHLTDMHSEGWCELLTQSAS
jgi:hypothetical protein